MERSYSFLLYLSICKLDIVLIVRLYQLRDFRGLEQGFLWIETISFQHVPANFRCAAIGRMLPQRLARIVACPQGSVYACAEHLRLAGL